MTFCSNIFMLYITSSLPLQIKASQKLLPTLIALSVPPILPSGIFQKNSLEQAILSVPIHFRQEYSFAAFIFSMSHTNSHHSVAFTITHRPKIVSNPAPPPPPFHSFQLSSSSLLTTQRHIYIYTYTNYPIYA